MKRSAYGYVLGVTVASSVAGCGGGSTAAAPAAAPAAPPAPKVCATFYADANLKGATLVSMGPADDSQTVPANFNDVMSSIAVSPGCTATAYADGNYGGQAVAFTQTTEVIPASMNDQMSSYKCTCSGGGVK